MYIEESLTSILNVDDYTSLILGKATILLDKRNLEW
jgi:hypothetical protein